MIVSFLFKGPLVWESTVVKHRAAPEDERPTTTPSGNPAMPHAELIHHPNFKAWFGDWTKGDGNHSQVLEAGSGEPARVSASPDPRSRRTIGSGQAKVLYHGTEFKFGEHKDLDTSDTPDSSLKFGRGIYMTEDHVAAKGYSGHNPKYARTGKEEPNVQHLYANIRNPYDLDEPINDDHMGKLLDTLKKRNAGADSSNGYNQPPGVDHAAVRQSIERQYKGSGTRGAPTGTNYWLHRDLGLKYGGTEVNKALRDMGHDGITHMDDVHVDTRESGAHRVWIAFHAHQVKHAANEGTFDPNESNMYKAAVSRGRGGMIVSFLFKAIDKPKKRGRR